jgi:hypothetical protein
MGIPNDVYDKLVEVDKKLLPIFIEGAQLVLGLHGLELVQYGTGENDPENDQSWAFYTRHIDTKEVADTGVNLNDIVVDSDLLLLFAEIIEPPLPEPVV